MAMEQVYHNHCTRAKPSETFAWVLRNIGVMRGANRSVGDWKKAIALLVGRKFSDKSEECLSAVQMNPGSGCSIEPIHSCVTIDRFTTFVAGPILKL